MVCGFLPFVFFAVLVFLAVLPFFVPLLVLCEFAVMNLSLLT
ncbi:MAG: hypothetical protein RHS_0382 [Robinsoniella sp. RHS]|nr:MAG: hypothetical protein RHS_0382 [Robinsoniella sp. RHS]